MPATLIPKALQPGDTIAFISPSARLNHVMPDVMSRATARLEARGYKVRDLYESPDTSIQSNISNRLNEIKKAFTDPTISAVFCTIGGTTFSELLPALLADTELHDHIRENPKIVVGYSDISLFHWFLHAVTGLRTFYGPGAIPELGEPNYEDDKTSPQKFCEKEMFRAISNPDPLGDIARSKVYTPRMYEIFENPSLAKPSTVAPTPSWVWIRQGKAQGRLFGGCLTVIARAQGVPAIRPDWNGRIVFAETATSEDGRGGNPIDRVKAGFADLIAGGAFDNAAGLVVGRPYGYDTEEERKQYCDVIRGLFCEGRMAEKEFPIVFGVDIGHTTPMVTLPFDALAELDSGSDSLKILEAGVQ